MGNPLNWAMTSGNGSLTWDGRQLEKIMLSNPTSALSFTYNSDGIRTKKRESFIGSTYDTEYIVDGTKILYEKKEYKQLNEVIHELYFYYDDNGDVVGLEYGGYQYYYQKNLQGDIVKIVDRTAQVVVEYTYDAWGNVISITGSAASTVGEMNPFRYRGYYYDTETGWYYLNSRYYDPGVGRYLNADAFIGTGFDILSYNMFAYCGNNPIMNIDPNGYSWLSNIANKALKTITAVAAVAVGVVAVVAAAPTIVAGIAGSCLAYAVCAAGAGIVAATFGAFELGEVATNKNPLKNALGEDLYNIGYVTSTATAAVASTVLSPPQTSTTTSKKEEVTIKGTPNEVGKAGEKAAGINKNTEKIIAPSGNKRIPDVLNHNKKVIGDVKNVKHLSYTSQMKDYVAYANQKRYSMELYVRQTTTFSNPMYDIIIGNNIELKNLPW